MQQLLEVEELVINDSFSNYCFQSNEEDIKFWKEYLSIHPSEKEKIEEAKQIVLGLHVMLKQEYPNKEKTKNNVGKAKIIPLYNISSIKKIILAIASVAAVFMVLFILNVTKNNVAHEKNAINQIAGQVESNNELVFTTRYGEKKFITLPDNSTFHLNSGSTLRVDKNFGRDNRNVYLSGEALFDVTHNASLPFIVHTDNYEVKVLGTLFNVKAYPGDKLSETSLLRGRVVITMKNSSRNIVLIPDQKAVIDNTGDSLLVKENRQDILHKTISLLPLSYSTEDSSVIETAWAQNKLEIVNENFAEMKDKLERWYDVKINFKDAEVSKYTFTATFERETIEEALKALQDAYHFNFSINGDEVIISK